MFFDPKEKIYYELGEDMGYMLDTGNNDARTEGMSYGMMMAVQMDRKDIFDRLWLFSKIFMYQSSGKYEGTFAWSVGTDGKKTQKAQLRMGKSIMPWHSFLPQHVGGGDSMWNLNNYYVKFVPETPFTDPSYHLPHFYEIFAERANEEDREFWRIAAIESRKFLKLSVNPVKGMTPEYSEYDGTQRQLFHDGQFYSDAYRVAMNIGLDASWFGQDESLSNNIDKLQAFFSEDYKLGEYYNYMLDGTALNQPTMHPVAIIATNAAGSLAAKGNYRLDWVRDFWNTPLRTSERR